MGSRPYEEIAGPSRENWSPEAQDLAGRLADHIDTDRMTPVELRATREWLGLSNERLAAVLNNRLDQVRRWETGRAPIPPGVRGDLLAIVGDTEDAYREMVNAAQLAGYLKLWDDDEAFAAEVPHYSDLGARWHRQLAARAAHETGARLVPAEPKE